MATVASVTIAALVGGCILFVSPDQKCTRADDCVANTTCDFDAGYCVPNPPLGPPGWSAFKLMNSRLAKSLFYPTIFDSGTNLFVIGGATSVGTAYQGVTLIETIRNEDLLQDDFSQTAPWTFNGGPSRYRNAFFVFDPTFKRIFLVGGDDLQGNAYRSDSYQVKVCPQPDATCVNQTTSSLVLGRQGAAGAFSADLSTTAYVVGGRIADGGLTDSVEAVGYLGSGILSPFARAGTLTRPRTDAVATIVSLSDTSGLLYVIGGSFDGQTATDSIEQAPVYSDGGLGAFSEAGQLVEPRMGASLLQLCPVGTQVFVFGGGSTSSPSSALQTVEGSVIGGNALGIFTEQTPFTTRRMGMGVGAAMLDGGVGYDVYVAGGANADSRALDTLEHARLICPN